MVPAPVYMHTGVPGTVFWPLQPLVWLHTQACVTGMFEIKDFSAFKQHLRDFLVQTKSFASQDNADLFAEEAEKQRQVDPPFSPPHHSPSLPRFLLFLSASP